SLLPFSGPLSILPSFPTRRSSDLYYPATRVIFALNRLRPIALYYGNDESAAPRYDAKLIAAQLLRSERTAVALGPQETLKSERVTETLSGSARYILWGALGIVVAALLLL